MAELTVLHTSDWHLGHQLYRTRRDAQFAAFLDWLLAVIIEQKVDVLVVAGDIFDTGSPNASAQKLYYDFLGKAARTSCRQIVITAGNHDSPSFLTAPRELLQSLEIIVVGNALRPEQEVHALRDASGRLELVLCAVPYLRERDVRIAMPGESAEEKAASLVSGIVAHYAACARKAREILAESGSKAPVLATGHLFAVGAELDASGEHELCAGSLAALPIEALPQIFDYVALGHLHRAQVVGGNELRRYSGSPLPMSFAEADQAKSVTLVRFKAGATDVSILPVPPMQRFASISGSRRQILAELQELLASVTDSVWVEITHDGSDDAFDLNHACHSLVEGSLIQILCVKAHNPAAGMALQQTLAHLENFSEKTIFEMLLERKLQQPAERAEMLAVFEELRQLYQESKREN